MTDLRLAKTLALPLDAITEPFGILGNRGQGKTNTAVVFVEELLEQGQQTVIVDPTDVWWGLKSSKDGKHAGYPVVVLGGKKQDLPLSSGDGKTIAEFVVAKRASVILSTRHFESKAQETTFLNAFFRRLYYLKGQQDAPAPLSLILDECSRYIPQRVMGEDAACVGAVQQIVRQGRSSGLGVVLIDQRPATVNKDVLDLVETLIVHRVTGPKNRKAITEWVEQHDEGDHRKEFLATLAALERGEAWVWSPGYLGIFQRVKMRERRTFDSSYTPKVGETRVTPTRLAAVDLEALRAELAATIEKAQAEDPKALQRRIRELEAEARNAVPVVRADTEAVERARAQGRQDGYDIGLAEGHRSVVARLHDVHREAAAAEHAIHRAVRLIGEIQMEEHSTPARGDVQLDAKKGTGANDRVDSTRGQQVRSTPEPRVTTPPRPVEGITPGGQKILNALAELHAIGVAAPSRKQLGMYAGYNLTGGTGAQHIADLAAAGYLEKPAPGAVALTRAGHAIADSGGTPRTLREVHARVLAKLTDGQRRIAEYLITIHPHAISRADLGAAVGYNLTGGTGAQHVADLITVGAAERAGTGKVVASALLFPQGLPR